jgi:hypothetical protein
VVLQPLRPTAAKAPRLKSAVRRVRTSVSI